MAEDKVTISKREYERLLLAERKLDALKAEGVDNWEGYSIAMRQLHEDEDDGS